MAKKRIIDLPNLESGSVNTILVGHDNGVTYQIPLNILTASVVEMLSQSTDARLDFLEEFQNDFYLISASIDTKIAAATNEQSLAHLVTTSSLNTFTQSYQTDSASFTQRIIDATNEQDLSYLATTQSLNDVSTSVDSRLDTLESFSSSADNRYVLSGSITQTTWDNIANKPNNIVSSSTQIEDLGFITASTPTDLSSLNTISASYLAFTQSYYSDSSSFNSRIISGSVVAGTISSSAQISAFGFISTSTQIPTGTISSSTQITNLGFVSGTYETTGRNIVSSSSQLTSSFDTRYAISASFVSSSNLSSIRTITSASYAALTPISGTLYIIIG